MGLLIRSLSMLLILLLSFLGLPFSGLAQNPGNLTSARALDAVLQDYAFRAFVRPRTGVSYEGTVPSDLAGVEVSAMRLVRGSLKARGVRRYKEFEIPKGVDERPWVKRLVLVYQNLGNRSEVYYPLPGFTYLAPVLGLLVYNATNLSATGLPELNITATLDPIRVHFSNVSLAPSGSIAKCVWFDLQGSVNFSNVSSGNQCSTTQQGHFSVVVESVKGKGKKSKRVWIIVGSVLGGLLLLILLAVLALWAKKQRQHRKIARMERAADAGEALLISSVGGTRAPVAIATRTQPVLEHDYVP